MQIPNAEQIRAAVARLAGRLPSTYQDEIIELDAAKVYGDFRYGFILGLETARVMLKANPDMVAPPYNPEDLL